MEKTGISDHDTAIEDLAPQTVVIQGVPLDWNSSFMEGPALGPTHIRRAFHSDSSNLCAENGLDLIAADGWKDMGDITLPDPKTTFDRIEKSVDTLLAHGARPLTLGGDHSITFPILRAFARHYENIGILHLDAHPDLYDELGGNRYSHACPFARIMEQGLAGRLVQVGIRTLTPHQREQARRFNVEVLEMRHWQPGTDLNFAGPVYVSLDLDCLDPAFAPGVSHHEPGGLSTRDVLGIIQNLKGRIVGADIVELNPERDPSGVTAMVAAKLLKEFLGRMIAERVD
jgi:arginase